MSDEELCHFCKREPIYYRLPCRCGRKLCKDCGHFCGGCGKRTMCHKCCVGDLKSHGRCIKCAQKDR